VERSSAGHRACQVRHLLARQVLDWLAALDARGTNSMTASPQPENVHHLGSQWSREAKLLLELLDLLIEDARIDFLLANHRVSVGATDPGTATVAVRVNDPGFFRRVLASGSLGMAEAFMGREFELEEGSLTDFLTILIRNRIDRKLKERLTFRLTARMLWLRLSNKLRGQLKNIQVHYDKDDDALFEAFLDPAMIYSCGYVRDPGAGVEQFQIDKMERICRKLQLAPGHRLVDIGCGYGGMLIYAVQHYGVTGKGVTIGRRHYERAKKNVAAAGLADRIEIEFAPYQRLTGTFDRMLSLGMMEHLDRREYGRFTRVVRDHLTPDGIGLFHFIGCTSRVNEHDPFIQKYILPDSNQPKLSEFVAALEDYDMAVLDVENMARHYGYTLSGWAESFRANSPRLDPEKYDDRFKRMWLYYLECAAAASFASAGGLFQILFAKNYPPPMPLQRV
jgi:cyclopropane-fatty-acyl-phospholipid synthase